jgi:type II secretory pathway pseudopilin PulG
VIALASAGPPSRRTGGAAGWTLVELLVVCEIAIVLCAIAVPEFLAGLDDRRTRAAARYVAGRMFHARAESLKRSVRVGYQFRLGSGADGTVWHFSAFTDDNGNGIRTADISAGVDKPLWPAETLSHRFSKVWFGLVPGVPAIGGGTGGDPIRVGTSRIVSFHPNGTMTSGTLYLRGSGGAQYAVRLFGVTGRTRVFRYVPGRRVWTPM